MATSKPTRTTPQQQEQIRDAYQAGTSMERIAETFGIGVASVHRILKKLGVASRSNLKPIETGTRFGSLTVVRYLGKSLWLCLCDCGTEEKAGATALRGGVHVRCVRCRMPEAPPERKTCTACGTEYPNTAEFFTRSNQFRFGLKAKCKKCFQPEIRDNGARTRRSLRMEILSHYSGGGDPRCVCCGEWRFGLLALDHIEGSSRADYRIYRNMERFYRHIKREGFSLKAQTLCHNCNGCKFVYGYCVHQGQVDPMSYNRGHVTRIDLPPVTEEELALAFGRMTACRLCHRIFPRSGTYFPSHKKMADGLLFRCKECDRKDHFLQAKARRERDKAIVLARYCGELPYCSCCGIANPEFLTIDHVDGGGNAHRKAEKIGNMWAWAIKNDFPAMLRIQCYSCNMGRQFNGGVCPHDA